jgi:hypothetical protein
VHIEIIDLAGRGGTFTIDRIWEIVVRHLLLLMLQSRLAGDVPLLCESALMTLWIVVFCPLGET